MPTSELRSRYYEYLLTNIQDTGCPSTTMLDRIEQAIPDRESFERYVGALLDKVTEDRHPSPMMLERIRKLLARLPDDGS